MACQWNYPTVSMHYAIFYCGTRHDVSDIGSGARTKSSPIGPAEQEEGGSLKGSQHTVQLNKVATRYPSGPESGRCVPNARWRGDSTYRSRSASSFLIRLRAMTIVC